MGKKYREWSIQVNKHGEHRCHSPLMNRENIQVTESAYVRELEAKVKDLENIKDLYERTLKICHRKHNQGDDSLGWSETCDHIHAALANGMGDKAYQNFLSEWSKG